MLYNIQINEYQEFMKGAKRYAITKITDRPKKLLEDTIDLREEVMNLGDKISKDVNRLHTLIRKSQYDHSSDEGIF